MPVKQNFGGGMKPPSHLTALRAFEAAARTGSVKRAAAELGVTPTAVGQQVRALEDYVGRRLFRRSQTGQRLMLTDEAQAVLPELTEAMHSLGTILARLRAERSRSVLTVTVTPAFAAKWLVPRLDRFRAVEPEIDVRLDVTERLVDLAGEDVDVGIRYGRGNWPGLAVIAMLDEDVFPVCSPILATAEAPLSAPADLRHHTLIHDGTVADATFPSWQEWLRVVGVEDVNAERGLWVNSSTAAVQAAMLGQGVALGRSVLVTDDLAAGRLVRPFIDPYCPAGRGYLIVRPEGSVPKRVGAFIAWLQDETQQAS